MEVTIFENKDFGKVRTMEINGEPWFVGKDVADALGFTNSRKALADHVDEEDKQIIQRSQIVTLEIPNRGLTIINESGVYSLVFGSKLPEAKKFKRWVTSEVLPAIRKHGSYTQQTENLTEDAFIYLFQSQKEIKQEQAQMKSDITYLKEESPIAPEIKLVIEKERKAVVTKALGGYDSPAYKNRKLRSKVFNQASSDFKDQFKVPRYDMVKKRDIEQAQAYWKQWQPPTNLKIEIDNMNKQTTLELN